MVSQTTSKPTFNKQEYNKHNLLFPNKTMCEVTQYLNTHRKVQPP